jgi:hypothetical protein
MTREEWFCLIQDNLAARMNDAPDKGCLSLVEGMLQTVVDFSTLIERLEETDDSLQA